MLQAQTKELLDSKLIEFSNRKYASFIIIHFKKDIFNNWTKKKICGYYKPIKKRTKSNRYVMPTYEEIFNTIRHIKILSMLDLRSKYHQLLVKKDKRYKIIFWKINKFKKDRLYQ